MATARSPVVTVATTICTKPIRPVRYKKPKTSTDTSRFFLFALMIAPEIGEKIAFENMP